ncbi:MAG: PAS domain S-box protein, partial [Candidatus Omnitrophica bacterium]|nr:PAS domain S-box protein [Candidatus Omnitrophota bacterium]
MNTFAESIENFFEISLDLCFLANAEGFFLKVNSSFTRTLGWSKSELLSRCFSEFIHPDDIENTEAAVISLKQGSQIHAFENRFRTKQGGYRHLQWSSWLCPKDGLLYGMGRNITA